MTENHHIYQHFHPQEKQFIDKLLDLVERMELTYTYQLTDFLNPRQIEIAKSVLGHQGVTYMVSREICPMEEARLIIAPDYYELVSDDFEISLVEIDYPSKFHRLTHRQVLGALLHQLGVRRSVLGDILVHDGRVQFFIDSSKLAYLQQEITRIGRVPVSFRLTEPSQLLPHDLGEERLILSTSMRVDRLVSLVTGQSRGLVTKLIEQGKVKCDHAQVDKNSLELAVGNLISVRGYGRFLIVEHVGVSKQGKNKLIIRQLVSK